MANKTFEELNSLVIQWAQDRKIIQNSTAQAQFMKAVSEMGELSDALMRGNGGEIEDGVGDVFVCLINLCAMLGFNPVYCLELAYEEIKDRKGTLLPSGVFQKEVL